MPLPGKRIRNRPECLVRARPAAPRWLDVVELGEQRRLATALQERFVAAAPVLPLFPSPSWAEYSTARFTGFPSADDPYARPTPNRQPECLLVLTRLRPR